MAQPALTLWLLIQALHSSSELATPLPCPTSVTPLAAPLCRGINSSKIIIESGQDRPKRLYEYTNGAMPTRETPVDRRSNRLGEVTSQFDYISCADGSQVIFSNERSSCSVAEKRGLPRTHAWKYQTRFNTEPVYIETCVGVLLLQHFNSNRSSLFLLQEHGVISTYGKQPKTSRERVGWTLLVTTTAPLDESNALQDREIPLMQVRVDSKTAQRDGDFLRAVYPLFVTQLVDDLFDVRRGAF